MPHLGYVAPVVKVMIGSRVRLYEVCPVLRR